MKNISKKYYNLVHLADQARGRKEVVSLLKKAANLKSKIDEKFVA